MTPAPGGNGMADLSRTAPRPRHALIDMARGTAILLMFVYHFSWDLTFFGYARFQLFTDPFWIWFAYVIVSIFLAVMGVAQVMARNRDLNSRTFFRRLALIVGAAAIVTAATYWMDPATFIFFGVLHHVALASILLLAVIHLPSALLIALALATLAAPHYLQASVFAEPWLLWVGLSPEGVQSVDYVPLLPWFAVPMAGVVLGRWMVRNGVPGYLSWDPVHFSARGVRWVGRNSLVLYLVHQPIFFGGLYVVAAVV
jgi:uncharacterized membrane protein